MADYAFALGEDWVFTAAAKNAADDPLDLTGAVAIEFRVVSRPFRVTIQPTLMGSASLAAGTIEVPAGAGGTCTITIAGDAQDDAVVGLHDFEWFVITGDGGRSQQKSGSFEILQSLRAIIPEIP